MTIANAPADPFTLFSESIDDLLIEANNYLDGKEIEGEDQEAAVASILTRLRREAKGADEQRAAEKKPHDEAGAAVQAKWKPLLSKAETAIATAKKALASYLTKKEEAKRAAVEAANEEARRLAEAAAQTAAVANPESLADQTALKIRQENAAAAAKAAAKLGRSKVQAKGGERAVGLRSVWTAEVTNPVLFARWAWEHRRGEYLTFLDVLAAREATGPKTIPGLIIHESKVAV